jgi:DNA-binding transcriptional ArsR family regulator
MAVEISLVAGAVADGSRRRMLGRLAHGPATTGQLAELFPISRPAVSQHVRVLADAGLIRTTVVGRHRWHELIVEPLLALAAWAEQTAANHDKAPPLRPAKGER